MQIRKSGSDRIIALTKKGEQPRESDQLDFWWR